MDTVISSRIDEGVAGQIRSLAHRLHTSKKNVIEKAILLYSKEVDGIERRDILGETSGVWQRNETAARTVEKARETFRRSITRHHR
jgi:predicted transcriptional regulator